ncbi:MAG TPA: arginine repressor, partial [Anaeromyxobacteraceae bacterium]
MSPERRRQAVARLLRRGRIGTQEALLSALRREGFRATQATLSRDLARLGARRVLRPEGGAVYELSEEGADAGLSALRGLALSVTANVSLVVVRTRPGSAPAVARAVDLMRLDGVLGTIAGDDTIFVA